MAQNPRRMYGGASGAVSDLHSAREAWRDDHRIRRRGPQGRQQTLFGDLQRHLIMFLLVTKRTRQAAAARVEFRHGCTGDASQQSQQRRRADERALMTVRLHYDLAWAGSLGLVAWLQKLLEGPASSGDRLGHAAKLAAQQSRIFQAANGAPDPYEP